MSEEFKNSSIKPCIFCEGGVHKFDAIVVDEDTNRSVWQETGQEGLCHEECFDEFEDIMR